MPRGLSMASQARPGATTTVAFQIARNGDRTTQVIYRAYSIAC